MRDDVPSLTLGVLRNIQAGIATTNARLESLEHRFESLERTTARRFESLERTTARGFEGVAERFDHLRDFAG